MKPFFLPILSICCLLIINSGNLLAQTTNPSPLTPEQRAVMSQAQNLSSLEAPYQITELGDTLKVDMRFSSKVAPITTLSEREQLKSDIRLIILKITDYQNRLSDNPSLQDVLNETRLFLQEKQNKLNTILINPSKNLTNE